MFSGVALAPRLFLALHDPFTGKPGTGPDLLARGVSTAAIATLLLSRRLDIADGKVVAPVPAAQGAPLSGIDAYVVDAVTAQGRGHSTRSWIESLGGPITGLVADDLVDDGLVRRERRMLSRGTERYPAVDVVVASGPRGRMQRMVSNPADFDLENAVITAIIAAIGADRAVLQGDGLAELFVEINRQLPRVLRQLMDALVASTAALALTVRR